MKKKRFLYFFCLSFLLGCPMNTVEEYIEGSEQELMPSSIFLTFSSSTVRSIQPDISLNITSYDIIGLGPDSATFTENDFSGEELEILNLSPGLWNIHVDGKNSSGIEIGAGEIEVELFSGENNSAVITIFPINGTGSVDLTFNWPDGQINNPVVSALFGVAGNTLDDVDFIITGNEAAYNSSSLDNGFYTLLFTLKDGIVERYNHVEVLQVINGQETSASIELDEFDLTLPTAMKPSITPLPGTYSTSQSVRLSSVSPGTEIRYSINGSIPSETSGILYSGPFSVDCTQNIKAVAYGEGYNRSTVLDSSFEIVGTIAIPEVSINEGNYFYPIEIELYSDASTSLIVYTLDGTDPVPGIIGQPYSEPIIIDTSLTLKAVAYSINDFSKISSLCSANYTITGYVPDPVFSVTGGDFYTDQIVEITCADNEASIYYSLDGSVPDKDTALEYLSPINISGTAILKAIAVKENWGDSGVTTAEYNLSFPFPVFSLAGGTFNTEQTVELTIPEYNTDDYNIYYTLDGTSPVNILQDNSIEAQGVKYSEPINITKSGTTLRAFVFSNKDGWFSSLESSEVYVYKPSTPEISIAGGTYIDPEIELQFNTATDGAVLKYTTDGSLPAISNGSIGDKVVLSQDTEVKVVAMKAGWEDSDIVSEVYDLDSRIITPEHEFNSIDTSPVFSWSGAYDKYQIEISDDSLFENIIEQSEVGDGIFVPTSLSISNSYYWRIRPEIETGTWGAWFGNWSYSLNLVWENEIPLNNETIIDTSPDLNWDDIVGAQSYQVRYSVNSTDFSSSDVYDCSSSELPLPELCGMEDSIYWQVRAINEDGVETAWSNTYNFLVSWSPVFDDRYPYEGITIKETLPVFISGDRITDVSLCQIKYALSIEDLADTITIYDMSTLSYSYRYKCENVIDLGQDVFWQVRAVNSDGVGSNWSSIMSFCVDWNPVFNILSPKDGEITIDTTPYIDWANETDSYSYRIRCSSSEIDITSSPIIDLGTSEYQYPEVLAQDDVIYWQICGVNIDGVASPWSSINSFTVSFAPDFYATGPENGGTTSDLTPLLDWEDIPGTETYLVRYSTDETSLSSMSGYSSDISEYQHPVLSIGETVYWQVKAVNEDSVESQWSQVFNFTTREPQIGDIYEGGYLFYLDGSGGGMVVATSNQDFMKWGGEGISVGGTSTAFGSGETNTTQIISKLGYSSSAAKKCADLYLNGYSDWYLPSYAELSLIYTNLHMNGYGNFTDSCFWSSSEISDTKAYHLNFSTGEPDYFHFLKEIYNYVRAVRSF